MDLRESVINKYLSSSHGVHAEHTHCDARAYQVAYRRHLRGWINRRSESESWLDLGCGQGDLLQVAQVSFGYSDVTGIDLSPEMASVTRARGLKVIQGDVLAYVRGLKAGSQAVVSCFDFIEHLPKNEGFDLLQNVYRILAPGGILLLKLPNAYCPMGFGITANDLTHEAAYTEATILQSGYLAGFVRGQVREVGPLPFTPLGLVRWILWRCLRLVFISWDIVETGAPRSKIYTRVMLVRLEKRMAT